MNSFIEDFISVCQGYKEGLMSPEILIGVSTTVIAFCALGFTIWQSLQIRKHNILSVQPHLTTWNHTDNDKHTYIIELINNGIGPALIKSFLIQVDGKEVNGEGSEPIIKALKILFPNYSYNSYQTYLGSGYMMSAKERRVLVQVQFFGGQLPASEEVDHAIKRARLLINYESIYGISFKLDTDSEVIK